MQSDIGLGARLLIHRKGRLLAASASVAVAVAIMFIELGLFTGVLDSQSLMVTLVRGDLVVMNIARSNLHRWDRIKAVRLDEIAALPEVERVTPIYEDTVGLKSPDDKRVRRIVVYAIPPDDIPLDIGDPAEISRLLKIPNGFLFDRRSRPIFGTIRPGDEIKIDEMPLHVTGYVDIGPDVVNDGAIVMSEGDWRTRFPNAKPIMGVIHLKPGENPEKVRAIILARLPPDIRVQTPDEARQRENAFTLRTAPIGILFGVGLFAGLVIGVINCYQVLFNEVSDRLAQYATLKAMGFSNWFLRRIIFEQALVLSWIGFAVGLVFSIAAYHYIAWKTDLAVRFTMATGLSVFVLTVAMCILAGWIAIRRVAAADPAALY
jgi:putative ABC transport system permease protein